MGWQALVSQSFEEGASNVIRADRITEGSLDRAPLRARRMGIHFCKKGDLVACEGKHRRRPWQDAIIVDFDSRGCTLRRPQSGKVITFVRLWEQICLRESPYLLDYPRHSVYWRQEAA
jgi:hypothetical protein